MTGDTDVSGNEWGGIELQIAKENALADLNETYKNASDAVKQIISDNAANITGATTVQGVADAKAAIIAACELQIAKEDAIKDIEEEAGDKEYRSADMQKIVEDYTNAINGATTTEAVEELRIEGLAKAVEQHMLDCSYEEVLPIADNTDVKLYLGGKNVGIVTIHEVEGGYAIEQNGHYIAYKNGKVVESDKPFAWRYNGIGFCVTDKTSTGKGGLFELIDMIITLIRTDGWQYQSYTSYYLSSLTTVSMTPVKAELRTDTYSKTGHNYGDWKDNGDGTHTHICSLCGDKQTEAHSFGADHKCSKCGALDPDFYQVNATVSKSSSKILFVTNYTYKIQPNVKGADVKKVEYSLDGVIIWFTGTSFTLPNNNYTFRFRITDSTGHVTYFTAKNGTNVTK